MSGTIRAKWAAIGAAVAVLVGAGGIQVVDAVVSSGSKPIFVSITPCRLIDTRNAPPSPVGPGATLTLQVTGSTGNCTGIPADAVGAALNVTAINGSTQSFLTVYPADAGLPTASNLNWRGGDPPTPNKVDVKLSPSGQIKLTNNAGTVHLAVDLVGYYVDHTHDDLYYRKSEVDALLAAANALPPWVVTVGPSGADFTTVSAALASITDASATNRYEIRIDPGVYVEPQGVTLKNYVDIVGSGAGRTTISSPQLDDQSGTVTATGVVNAEVRALTIKNTGGPIDIGATVQASIAIWVATTSGQIRLVDVALHAGVANGEVIAGAFVTGSSDLTLVDSTIVTGDAASENYFGSIGVYGQAGSVMLDGVDVSAWSAAVSGSGATVRVLDSELTGRNGKFATYGNVQLVGVYAYGILDPGATCAGVIANGAVVKSNCLP